MFLTLALFLFQDAIDLFLGNYSVDEVEPASPLHVKKDWKFLAVSMGTLLMFGETHETYLVPCISKTKWKLSI